MKRFMLVAFAALALCACTSSHILVGSQRPPIPPEQVRLYLDPPATFEKVAVLESNNNASFAFTSQQKTNKVIERLKTEAAALGANGILLEGVRDQYAGSVGVANAWTSGNSAWGTGVSAATFVKVGSGIAIYVPPGSDRPPVAQQAEQANAVAAVPQPMSLPVSAPAPVQQRYEPDPAKRCDACTRLTTP